MDQDYFYQTMILGGLITLNLIFILSTYVVVKVAKISVSGASMIASLVFTWPSILWLVMMFPKTVESGWVSAFFMLTALGSYLFWLWFFQPNTLQDLIRINLRNKELESLDLKKEKLLSELSKTGSNKKFQDTRASIKIGLSEIKTMRREVKIKYLKSNLLKKLLSKIFKIDLTLENGKRI